MREQNIYPSVNLIQVFIFSLKAWINSFSMKWWSGLDVWNDSLFEKLVTDWGLLRRRVLWTLWSICACTFVIINVSLKSKFSYCAQFISACYSIYIYIYIPCSASKMTFLFCCIMNQSYLTPYLTTFFFLSNSKSHPTLFSHWISSFTLKNNVRLQKVKHIGYVSHFYISHWVLKCHETLK